MPARAASACNVQGWPGSACMALIAAPICLSARAKSHPTPPSRPFRQMQPQGLHQHHMGEVLDDQEAARLPLAQLLHHPLHGPAQRGPVRFLPDMDDGRQHPQQDAGMIAVEGEAAADEEEIPAAIPGDDAAAARGGKYGAGLDRRQAQVACQAERPPARQQEAIPRLQPHRLRHALDGQPALAGNHGAAFDAFLLVGELDRPVSRRIEAGGHVVARFQQRQDVGERIHGPFRTIAKVIRISQHRSSSPNLLAW